jgi:hypothetical protein
MNVQFRNSPEQASSVHAKTADVKTAIADCDIHPARATVPNCVRISPSAGKRISKPTTSIPIRA